MFKLLGVLLAFYTLFSAHRGEVYAKSGIAGRTIARGEEPRYFWCVIGIYAVLSIALLTIF